MIKWPHMVLGLAFVAEGLLRIASFGWLRPDVHERCCDRLRRRANRLIDELVDY